MKFLLFKILLLLVLVISLSDAGKRKRRSRRSDCVKSTCSCEDYSSGEGLCYLTRITRPCVWENSSCDAKPYLRSVDKVRHICRGFEFRNTCGRQCTATLRVSGIRNGQCTYRPLYADARPEIICWKNRNSPELGAFHTQRQCNARTHP